ncbi:hypothetical protein [Costertonia aggregata]|uniref:Uncharacterized protein n=1 Tax=Costertonia aggregata TaxID=343403 RepID=A0A7H9ANU0_9FLAO|nr:hypothetical protein [Costertonia aggregata]QLG45100.1 hypothetical protein HYG79_06960 [Costertonia aggregata]
MKTLLVSIFLIVSSNILPVQEVEEMTGSFVGFEADIYYFTDDEGFSNEFHHIADEALKKFDLKDNTMVGKSFVITYTSNAEIDEDDEEMVTNTIIDLKMVE